MIKKINLNCEEQERIASISNDLARAGFCMKARSYRLLINLISLINPEDKDLSIYEFSAKELDELLSSVKNRSGIEELRKVFLDIMKNPAVLDIDKSAATTFIVSYDNNKASIFRIEFSDAVKEHVLLVAVEEITDDSREKITEGVSKEMVVETVEADSGLSKKIVKTVLKHYTKVPIKFFNKLDSIFAMRLYVLAKSYQSRYSTDEFSIAFWEFFFGKKKGSIKRAAAFKQDVLDRAIKEINERTDIFLELIPVKKGRRTEGFYFKISKKKDLVNHENFCENNESQLFGSEFNYDTTENPETIANIIDINNVVAGTENSGHGLDWVLMCKVVFNLSEDEAYVLLKKFGGNIEAMLQYLSTKKKEKSAI